jgi:hypothetical protein
MEGEGDAKAEEKARLSQATAVPTARGNRLGREGESETSSAPACRSGGVQDATPRAEGGRAKGEATTEGVRNAQNRVKMLRLLSKVSLLCQQLCVCACASATGRCARRALLVSTTVLRRHYACLSGLVTQLQGARAHVTCYKRTQVSGVFESTDANQVSTESVLCREGFRPSPPAWREQDGRRMRIPSVYTGDERVMSCMLASSFQCCRLPCDVFLCVVASAFVCAGSLFNVASGDADGHISALSAAGLRYYRT